MKKYLSVAFVLLMSFTGGCSKDNVEPQTQPTFEISESALEQNFEKTQTSRSIPVSTTLDREAWQVSSDQSWCLAAKDLSGSSAGIKIAVEASEEPEVRTATVTVKTTLGNKIIKVRQLGYGPAILIQNAVRNIGPGGGELDIVVTANVEYAVSRSENSAWIADRTRTRAFTDKSHAYTVQPNDTYEARRATFTFTAAQYPEVTASCEVVQQAKASGVSDVAIEGDVKVTPTGGRASEQQPGQGIENSYDGRFGGTPYHSVWNQSANFPVTLEYFFDGSRDIDYCVYHTRNGNGNFGQLDIYVMESGDTDYRLYGSYDFLQKGTPSKVVFGTQGLSKPTKIKFAVKSGLGNFVSCDEMEFFQRNAERQLDRRLLTVFKDITCTELKEGVTDAEINALPGYFANIAVLLKNNTYEAAEKEFRIREYAPYSNPDEWAGKLITKRYSNLDNPTGIYIEGQDSVVILVGDTHGQTLSVQCIGEETVNSASGNYVQTAASGETRFLETGVNKVGFSRGGMLFIMYNTDLSSPEAKPVKIHIPAGSGKVGGFFDLREHQTNDRYKELIDKSTYKYFCVKGERIIFYFHREQMKRAVPYDIRSAIGLWDEIVGWQHELMGIENIFPRQMNNHIFAISPEGSYMWASDYRIAFVYTYLDNILLKDKVMAAKDNAWGPAHEIGHINQGAINWPSTTESSNNLFSNYTLHKLGKYVSRGSELSALAQARFVDKQNWWNMGGATYQGENPELHMRMNWQLWNYYHRCGYKTDFFPTLFGLLRDNRVSDSNPGAQAMQFVKMASRAANQNLTEFFDMWGLLEPSGGTIAQYGSWPYTLTAAMIQEAKNYMAQFPSPNHAFYYLEDRKNGDVGIDNYQVGDIGHYTRFKENTKITKSVTCTRSGQRIRMQNAEEAVAIEVKSQGKVVYFSNFLTFDVPASINIANAEVYAVQADGVRVKATLQ